MNVKELISCLSQVDPYMRVVVNGYEGGYDELDITQIVNIAPNLNKEDKWWDGEFSESVDSVSEAAILLPRKS
jgi:hypothetical protein